VLVIELGFLTRVDNRLLHYWESDRAAYYIGRGGVDIAKYLLMTDSPLVDSLNDIWAQSFPPLMTDRGAVQFEIGDEDGRINLNRLVDDNGNLNSKIYDVFRRLLVLSDKDPSLVDEIAAHLTPGDESYPGASGGRFRTRKELLKFTELEDIFYCLTIYSDGMININTAPALVIRSMSEGIDSALADEIALRRVTFPFGNPEQLARMPGVSDGVMKDIREIAKVRSSVFAVKVVSDVGIVSKTTLAVVERRRRGTVLLYFRSA